MEASVSPALWMVSVSMSEDLLSASIMRRRVVRSTKKFRSWMVEEAAVERDSSAVIACARRDARHG